MEKKVKTQEDAPLDCMRWIGAALHLTRGRNHVRRTAKSAFLSRNPMSFLFVGALLLASAYPGAVSAEGGTWYFSGGSDTVNGGITTPSKWKDASGNPAEAFSTTDSYVVRSGSRLRINNKSFPGGPVQFGDLSASSSGGIVHDYASTTVDFPNGAFFDRGYYWVNITTPVGSQRDGALSGTVTVRSPFSNPFKFYAPQDRRALYITAKFSSAAPPSGEGLTATDAGCIMGASCGTDFSVYLIGDCSDYKGHVAVTSVHEVAVGKWTTQLGIGDTTVGGNVTVYRGASISAVKGVKNTYTYSPSSGTVAGLEFRDGSVLDVRYDSETDVFGSLAVSSALVVDGKVRVHVRGAPQITSGRKVPILTAPKGQIDINAFELAFTDPSEGSRDRDDPPLFTRLEVSTADGRDTLFFVIEPMAFQSVSNSNSRNNDGSASAFVTAAHWDNEERWQDQSTMPSEFNYWADKNIRTTGDNVDYEFPGRSFTLAGGFFVIGGNRRHSFRTFRWMNNTTIRVMNGHSPVLCGGRVLTYDGNSRLLRCYNGSIFTIESEISGAGDIEILDESGTGVPYGNVAFEGLNTNFTGKVRVSREFYIPGSFKNQYMNLYISDERNLGGALPEFRYDALTLRYHGGLVVKRDVSLGPDSNRGIFVDYAGMFKVNEGATLVQGRTLTMNGLLWKAGYGTLTMAGPVRYLDAEGLISDMPRAGSNLFSVSSGTVKVAKHDAMDGLSTLFEEGASLVLAMDISDGNLVKYGIMNAKTEYPFRLYGKLKELPLTVEFSEIPTLDELPWTFGVVTVKNTPATIDAVKAILPSIRPCPGLHHKFRMRENEGEDTVTFTVTIEHVGSRVILR
ncbi:MAG: hypothetical protein IKJ37_07235 [Kiritimatiellae bacterium]|nr:hypothetical protein [Kiritimatiellia bacterium]